MYCKDMISQCQRMVEQNNESDSNDTTFYHPYLMAAQAYSNMIETSEDQAIFIQGLSNSGKVTFFFFLTFNILFFLFFFFFF